MCRLHIKETKIGLTDSTFLRVLNLLEKRFFFLYIIYICGISWEQNKNEIAFSNTLFYIRFWWNDIPSWKWGLKKIFERIILYFLYVMLDLASQCVSMCKRQFTVVKENICQHLCCWLIWCLAYYYFSVRCSPSFIVRFQCLLACL